MARGPAMTETKRLITAMKPMKIHYRKASKAIGLPLKDLMATLKVQYPNGVPNIKALAIWVDGVLWCGGDKDARNALFDRIESKAARIIDQTVKDARQPMHNAKGATISQSEAFMEELEADVALPEMDDEGPGESDLIN